MDDVNDAFVSDLTSDYDFVNDRIRVWIGTDEDTKPYDVHVLGHFAVDLTNDDGEVYEIRKFGDRLRCTCPDYVFRHQSGSLCKHGVAVEKLGLLRRSFDESATRPVNQQSVRA